MQSYKLRRQLLMSMAENTHCTGRLIANGMASFK